MPTTHKELVRVLYRRPRGLVSDDEATGSCQVANLRERLGRGRRGLAGRGRGGLPEQWGLTTQNGTMAAQNAQIVSLFQAATFHIAAHFGNEALAYNAGLLGVKLCYKSNHPSYQGLRLLSRTCIAVEDSPK